MWVPGIGGFITPKGEGDDNTPSPLRGEGGGEGEGKILDLPPHPCPLPQGEGENQPSRTNNIMLRPIRKPGNILGTGLADHENIMLTISARTRCAQRQGQHRLH